MTTARTPKKESIPSAKESSKPELAVCPTCKLELPKAKLKRHKRLTHPRLPRLEILEKSAVKSSSNQSCANCNEQSHETWLFHKTTRGAVFLCSKCKPKVLKHSFSPQALERRRVASLKATLRELKERKSKLPPGTIDMDLVNSIFEVEESINRPAMRQKKWSPVLSGSFEGGKRRWIFIA